MQNDLDEILCPICMLCFKTPITIQCGHTFCRSCLISSTIDQRICPICRQNIHYTPNKMRQDSVLNDFLQSYRKIIARPQKQQIQDTQIECKVQQLLLIEAKTDDLILPYNRVFATFELQNQSIIEKMQQRFVARQQSPYNKYGVICSLSSIKQIRLNFYQGIIQGKAFCNIIDDKVQNQTSLETGEDYFYRTCIAKQICQNSQFAESVEYEYFFKVFKKISQFHSRQEIYKRIDAKVFCNSNDPIPLFYSIIGILAMNNETKYRVVTSFNQEYRAHEINSFVKSVEHLVDKDWSVLIAQPQHSVQSQKYFYFFLFTLFFVYVINKYGYA